MVVPNLQQPGWTEGALFVGIGGFPVSVQRLGGHTVWASEIEPYACRVFSKHFPEARMVGDLTTWEPTPETDRVSLITGGFPCFVGGTLVLTRDGYCPIEDILVGDEVLTHLGRWRMVTATMRREDVEVWQVRATGVPQLRATAEHPVFARLRTGTVPRRKFAEPEWVPAAGLSPAHYVAQVLPEVQFQSYTPEFLAVVGRYLADGWLVERRNRPLGSGRVVFGIGKHKVAVFRERLAAAGLYAGETEERTAQKFHVTSNELFRFFQQFGRHSYDKGLPGWVFELDAAQAQALLAGFLEGDGYRDDGKRAWTASTVSRKLALGLALLWQRAYGRIAGVHLNEMPPTTSIEGRVVNQRDFYKVTFPDRNRVPWTDGVYGWKRVSSVRPDGRAIVYNLAVDEDESYVADGALVHNCQPASTAGRRMGTDDVRWLWPAYARIIRLLRPRYVLAENVSGLRSVNDGKAFEEVLTDLDALGYDAEWESIPASAVGAPHQRDRIWIVAYPRGFGRREVAGGPPPNEGADEGRPPEDHHVADGDGQGGGAGTVVGPDGQIDLFGGPKNHDPGEFFVFDGAAEALASFRETRGHEQWGAEPDVPRVAARVPDRVHRLRCLGNAIVPLVAEFVMSRIIEFDRKVVEAGCDRSFA